MNTETINQAIRKAGGLQALAMRCGVSYQAVQAWRARGQVPATHVLKIEEATRGKVSRHQLRPDIYPEK